METGLLGACSRVLLDEASAEFIRQSAGSGVHWEQLVEAAVNQAVLPLLYHHLHRTVPQQVPLETLARLRAHVVATTAQNLFLARALAAILDFFQAQGIRAIPYKGLLVAASAYGDLSLRQIGDLDLLVHPGDYQAGRTLLLAQGYRLIPEMDLGWESAFRSPDGKIEVDLHQALLPFWFGVGLDFDELWDRCTPVAVTGKTLPNLAPEDALTVLSLQLFKDTAQGKLVLRQVCDIAEVLRRYPELDWPRLLQRACDRGLQRELYLGLSVAHEALGAAIPDAVRVFIKADRSLQPFAAEAIQQVFALSPRGEHYWLPYLVRWPRRTTAKLRIFLLGLIHEGAKSTREWDTVPSGIMEKSRRVLLGFLRLLWMCAMPTEKERDLVSLPAALSPLYYLIRPIRLGAKYLRLSAVGRFLSLLNRGSRYG